MPARRSGERKPSKRPFSRKSRARRDEATVRKVFPIRGLHMMSQKALHEMAVSIRRRKFGKKAGKHKKRRR